MLEAILKTGDETDATCRLVNFFACRKAVCQTLLRIELDTITDSDSNTKRKRFQIELGQIGELTKSLPADKPTRPPKGGTTLTKWTPKKLERVASAVCLRQCSHGKGDAELALRKQRAAFTAAERMKNE